MIAPTVEVSSSAAEPMSPFLRWTVEDRRPIADDLPATEGNSLLVDLLRSPENILARLASPESAQATILGALGVFAGATAFFAAVVGRASGAPNLPALVLLATIDAMLALAAAIGPIQGASIVLAARIPMTRLVAILLCAAATGALVLAGATPVIHVLWQLDPVSIGPGSLLIALVLGALAGGARIYRLTMLCAESNGPLDRADRARVTEVSEIAMLTMVLTSSLAFWAFDLFFRG